VRLETPRYVYIDVLDWSPVRAGPEGRRRKGCVGLLYGHGQGAAVADSTTQPLRPRAPLPECLSPATPPEPMPASVGRRLAALGKLEGATPHVAEIRAATR
jgi:hypothetical protein